MVRRERFERFHLFVENYDRDAIIGRERIKKAIGRLLQLRTESDR